MTFEQVRNPLHASDSARLNLLTNGGFEIWQRGNGPFTAGALQGADRWYHNPVGNDTVSVSRDTANVDVGSGACAACTVTVGTGAGQTCFIQPNMTMTAPEWAFLLGRTLSFSIRVKTSTPNAVRAMFNNYYSSTNHFTYSSFHTGDGTYQTLTIPGVVVQTSPVPLLQVGAAFSASCTAYIDNAMLVVGSQPADYAPLHPADDLARCLRYYQRYPSIALRWPVVPASTGLTMEVVIPMRAAMPVTPTVTLTAGSRSNIASATSRYTQADGVGYSYVPTATSLDTYALNELYVLEANP